MVERKEYLNKLIKAKDKQIIKIVTGVRRCGKSVLLDQFQQYLLKNGVDKKQIIFINFEKIENEPLLEYHKLYDYLKKHILKKKITYIFLDEIQKVIDFQKAVDSLFADQNVDIYLTGSNANLLSGELATLLSGRYIEIEMLPLSFKEYLKMVGGNKKARWNEYFQKGGFPYAASIKDDDLRYDYLSGIYHTVLLKDIVERKKIQDVTLLESVIKFIFNNIGNIVSPKKISDTLISNGRKTTSATIENYIQALKEAYILYDAGRYDVKGRQHLKSLEKYYIVDQSLRSLLLANKGTDIGHILENIVFLELKRRGYLVSIGKIGESEIDFIAEKGKEKIYYQVATSILDQTTYHREITPLKKIADNYPKYLITMDEIPIEEEGIKQINIIDFLLK